MRDAIPGIHRNAAGQRGRSISGFQIGDISPMLKASQMSQCQLTANIHKIENLIAWIVEWGLLTTHFRVRHMLQFVNKKTGKMPAFFYLFDYRPLSLGLFATTTARSVSIFTYKPRISCSATANLLSYSSINSSVSRTS